MVKKIAGWASAWFVMTNACANDIVKRDVDSIMHPTNLSAIIEITIKENGATSPASSESSETCKTFVLTKEEVRAYLRQAGEVTHHDYLHMLDWSPCYASGSVSFSNGMTGNWGINQFKAGSLQTSDGRHIYLYCPSCRAKTFSEAAD